MQKSYEFSKDFAKNEPLFNGFKAIAFKSLNPAQIKETLALRNEKRVRMSSKYQGKISLEAHKNFIKNTKDFLYAFYELDELLGVCSLFRMKDNTCFLGIYTKASFKLAHIILKATLEIAKIMEVKTVYLEVRLKNFHAQKFFKRFGFSKTHQNEEYEIYELLL